MCILFIAVNQHPKFPLIIAANRDEFHARPTQASHFWSNQPNVLAGIDLRAGGTWMGITKTGRLAALTNIRAPGHEKEQANSRGELVSNFLLSRDNSEHYLSLLSETRAHYNGYNLLFGDVGSLQVFNSFENKAYSLNDGIYGLSNASLNSPWPKLDVGRSALAKYCQHSNQLDLEHLFELLRNDKPANDEDLPNTGVPFEWEKKLSSIFIASPDYGTRSSTILLVDKNKTVYWEERTFLANTQTSNIEKYEFVLKDKI